MLDPLWNAPPPEGWEAVVFFNGQFFLLLCILTSLISSRLFSISLLADVYTSAAHVLELVHLHLEESAGVTCAWDNYYYPGSFWRRPQQ